MNRDYKEAERPGSSAETVGLAFRAVIAQVVLHNYEVAETVGLSARDMQAIHLLQLRGPMSPGRLGSALGIASASVTALIDRLENSGYARRSQDPSDRRKLVVSLDEARLAADLTPRYAAQAAQLEAVLRRFSDDELAVIERFLRELNRGA